MATDYSGNQQTSGTPTSGAPVGGDLTGSTSLAVVTQIQGKAVPLPGASESGKVLQYNNATGAYVWVSPTVGSGGTSAVDKSGFTEGVDSFNPVGGVYNETLGTDPTEDSAVILRLTVKRAAHVNLRTAAGVESGTSGSPLRVDPTGTTPQPVSAVNLDLATSALRDAITGVAAAAKTLADVVNAVQATQTRILAGDDGTTLTVRAYGDTKAAMTQDVPNRRLLEQILVELMQLREATERGRSRA